MITTSCRVGISFVSSQRIKRIEGGTKKKKQNYREKDTLEGSQPLIRSRCEPIFKGINKKDSKRTVNLLYKIRIKDEG